jgi:NAD+ kinase
MNSSSAISRVGIVAKSHLVAAVPHLIDIGAWLRARHIDAIFESATAALMPSADGHRVAEKLALVGMVDMVVVLGGDGTLLSMADCIAAAGKSIPILGVNFGSLGFLTEVTLDELYDSLESVLEGHAHLETRMMLRARTRRQGKALDDRFVLNDVVITKGALSRIIDLSVAIGGKPVMRVRADGLIVATPTGSSAYNLAAGGPVVHPEVDAILLTPIAPHMLTNRPVVVPGGSDVRVEPMMHGAIEEVFVTFDGQSGHPLEADDVIEIRRLERPLRLVRAGKRTYFELLRQKLKWGER